MPGAVRARKAAEDQSDRVPWPRGAAAGHDWHAVVEQHPKGQTHGCHRKPPVNPQKTRRDGL